MNKDDWPPGIEAELLHVEVPDDMDPAEARQLIEGALEKVRAKAREEGRHVAVTLDDPEDATCATCGEKWPCITARAEGIVAKEEKRATAFGEKVSISEFGVRYSDHVLAGGVASPELLVKIMDTIGEPPDGIEATAAYVMIAFRGTDG